MSGSSLTCGISLTGAALLALGTITSPAVAGGNHGEPPPVYENNYSGPPIIRRIPGLRLLFGDPTMSEDEYNALSDKKKKKKHQFDETYYEPQPAPPKTRIVNPSAKQGTATTTATPTKPGTVTNPALPQKAAAATAKPLASGPLSCEQATSVVSGYGFASVEASTCTGKLYAFNAKRDGKSFAIKFDPASGELTEVRKLP